MIITQVGHRLKCRRQNIAGPAPAPAPSPTGPTKIVTTTAQGGGTGSDLSPLTAYEAMLQCQPGETYLFRGGSFDISTSSDFMRSPLEPKNSGLPGNPIIFKNYPGEIPILNGIRTTNLFPTVISLYRVNHIHLDGFKVWGEGGTIHARIGVWSDASPPQRPQYCVIKNCDITGGGYQTSHDNREGIRCDETDYTLITNNKIHGFRQSDVAPYIEWHNTSGYKGYNNTHMTLSHNDVYDNSCGIYFKRNHEDCLVQYNFIHNNYWNFFADAYNAGTPWQNPRNTIDNCLIVNSESDNLVIQKSDTLAYNDDFVLSNSTIYGADNLTGVKLLGTQPGHGFKVFNTIIHGFGNRQLTFGYDLYEIAECDHNNFGSHALLIRTYLNQLNAGNYSTLANWQASGELVNAGNPGVGSLAVDPLFINGSGTLSQIADFDPQEPSTRVGNRTGGVMGADLTMVGIK